MASTMHNQTKEPESHHGYGGYNEQFTTYVYVANTTTCGRIYIYNLEGQVTRLR